MKSTFEKKNSEGVFKFSLTAAEWDLELQNAYNRTKAKYKVPGFRPGHAPKKMIELHYGAGVFFDAAVDLCVRRVYSEEIVKHPELETFGAPDVSFEKPDGDDAFAFSATVTLYPDVKLGDYKGIKLPKIEYNVSDEEVNSRIDADLHHASRLEKVEREAKDGDVTVIDYVGTVDGVEFDGGKAENYELKLGSNTFIPGFEEQLVGVRQDEERDVKVKFPEEYHAENLKGKDAVFHVKVHEVREEQVPALDDAFVKEHTKYQDVESYKSGLRADLIKSAEERQRNARIDAVMNAVTENATCEVPHKIIHAEIDRMYNEMAQSLSAYGIRPEDYLKYNNSSVEQFKSERHEQAERNVKMRRVMRAIIDAEKLDVTDEEAQSKFDAMDERERTGLEAQAKANGADVMDFVKNDTLTDKFFDFLLNNNEYVLDPEKTESDEAKSTEKKSTAKKANGEKKPAAKKTAEQKADEKKE